ncbi:TonB-dependent receptor [Altererythrobacter ishigakiensis]|uniref:TonB-dependent receptor n=1 Tax=Altererythrobacter ishigakiensis TaxID=476157 RepID=A0A562UM30_9SPHN|nr:TonB-dependent receptor [Altererythrobacter ishigakiensis]TWJ06665.1 TonB-dependent receptor [Altererythrobacter ishigakiensis]
MKNDQPARVMRGYSASLKAGVAAIAMCFPSIAAAQDSDAENAEGAGDQDAQVTSQQPNEEGVIVVTGIRASLADALQQRRKADVFLDGISSDDIGSTPDLNLGEALARIPGVQINREGARRDATISIRGLPGRFTKTTVMGQTIASTTRGNNTGNPFGIFESAIFNGANVIKSFTPDTPSGGLAAQVDLRLNGALQRREGFVVRAEVDHEETTGDELPKFFISGAQRIGDRFGIYGNFAYSEQSFRRDTLRLNNYRQFTSAQVAGFADGTRASGIGADQSAVSGTPNPAFDLPAVGENGLDNAVIYPRAMRQFVQNNRGERFSISAGMAYEVSDNLELRLDGIFTRRNLSESNQDISIFEGHNGFNSLVSPLSAPVNVGVVDWDENGTEENVYLVPRVLISDSQTAIENRSFPALDESWAIYPQFNFENDVWRFKGVGTYSEARGRSSLNQYSLRVRFRGGGASTRDLDSNLDGIDDRGNDSILILDNGLGSLNSIFVDNIVNPLLYELDQTRGSTRVETGSGIGARDDFAGFVPPGPNQNPFNQPTSILALGFTEGVDRDLKSFDFETARKFEGGLFSEVEVGGYYSDETSRRYRSEFGGLGLNYAAAFDRSILVPNDGVAEGGAYLGGDIPGVELDNFLSLDIPVLESLLGSASQEPRSDLRFTPSAGNIRGYFPQLTPESAATITPEEILAALPLVEAPGGNTYLARPQISRPTIVDNNFDSSRETIELYAMAKFDFSRMYDAQLRGNFGVRYVKTDLVGQTNPTFLQFYDNLNAIRAANGGPALEFKDASDNDALVFGQAKNSFERFLPSMNLIYEITPDIVARAAFYGTFEALDLAEFTPTPTLIVENDTSGDIDDLDPEDRILGSDGNPIPRTSINISTLDVQPRRSTGFDLGLSWYNKPGSVVSIGFFRKSLVGDITRQRNFCPEGESLTVEGRTFNDIRFADINSTNPIEQSYAGQCVFTNDNGDPQRIRVSRTVNNPDTINVTGFEAQIQQTLDFLPGFLKNTGVVLNYTRVRSGGDNDVQLFNVAEDTYNIIGYYEDDFLEARLAYNHQSEIQRQGGSSFIGGNTIIAPRGQLDFSGAIKPMRGLEIRAEVFNITQSSRREYLGVEELFRLYEYDGRTYSLSATYRF